MSNRIDSIGKFEKKWEENPFPDLPYRSIDKDIDGTINHEICAECGGECCKRCGCEFSPDDFSEISFEFLKKEIQKGYITIEYINGEIVHQDNGSYILRVRNKEDSIVKYHFSKGPCILLGEKGCKLSDDKRPAGGRLLRPSNEKAGFFNSSRRCYSNYSLEDCCYEWAPHQKILYDLAEYFENKKISCSL